MHRTQLTKPAIVGLCLLTLMLAEGAAWAAPFACSGEAYVIQESGAQLNTIDASVSPFVFTPIGTTAGYFINNLGFRRTDGLLWAYRGDVSEQIMTIDDTGAGAGATLLGLGGLPATGGGTSYNSGDVSTDGSEMYFTVNGIGTVHTIALPGLALTRSMPITVGTGFVLDYAAHPVNGLLYGGDHTDGEMAELDPVSGIRTDKAVIGGPLPTGSSYGAAFIDAEGTLFLYRNSDGVIYEISGATTDTPTLVGTEAGASSPGFNDGAACVQQEIGAAKAMSSSNGNGLPSTITIDYVFENFSSSTLADLSAIDDLEAVFGTHGVDWTFTSISSSANITHNASFTGHSGATELIEQTAGTEQDLAVAATATMTVTLELLTHDGDSDLDDLFCNQIVVTGFIAGVEFGDVSTDGSDPDPGGDDIPAEDDSTCFMVPVELTTFSVD